MAGARTPYFVIPDLIRDPFLLRRFEWTPDQVRGDEARSGTRTAQAKAPTLSMNLITEIGFET